MEQIFSSLGFIKVELELSDTHFGLLKVYTTRNQCLRENHEPQSHTHLTHQSFHDKLNDKTEKKDSKRAKTFRELEIHRQRARCLERDSLTSGLECSDGSRDKGIKFIALSVPRLHNAK